MDVKDFVSDLLEQVSAAIAESDSVLKKPAEESPLEGVAYVYEGSGRHGWATNVEFDIAVTVNESADGGAKLSIPGIGSIGGNLADKSETTSRVSFKIPLRYISSN